MVFSIGFSMIPKRLYEKAKKKIWIPNLLFHKIVATIKLNLFQFSFVSELNLDLRNDDIDVAQ